MQKRFLFIDGIRGLAALTIVLFHALRANHISIFPLELGGVLSMGEAGVVIFFAISGFVIAHSLLKIDFGPSSLMRFVIGRAIRLDPAYWAAIFLAISFSIIASILIPGRPPKEYSFAQIVAHLFYAQELLGYEHINGVFWTLCGEIQFYFAIALAIATRSPRILIAVFIASLLWPLNLAPEFRGLYVNLFYTFLLGVGATYALREPAWRPWYLIYAGIILCIGVAYSNSAALLSSAMGVLLLHMGVAGKLSSALNWRWLQFVGMISYSLYLIHNPVTGATFRVWYMIAGHSAVAQLAGLMLSFMSCITFAWLFYLAIEKPCIALARSASRRNMPSPFSKLRVKAYSSRDRHLSKGDAEASTPASLLG